MLPSKTIAERIFFDLASLFALISALLYFFGLIFIDANMTGYGLSNDFVKVEFRDAILYGFFALMIAPFYSTQIWLFSLLGLLPLILKKYSSDVPAIVISAGMLFFFLFQVGASYDTGEGMAKEEMNDIALIYKNKAVEDFEVPKLKVQYKEADSSIKTVYGYGLDVPGDYFVLVMKDKVVAIKKSNVTTVIFKLDKNHED